jgi:gamma-glutamyl:cysteine ligase YbdK (ATP-grasp superfamily)
MAGNHRYKLFEAAGIEFEYMIADSRTLQVKPVADELLFLAAGHFSSDYDNDEISWSNELVNHVIELKTSDPAQNVESTVGWFHSNIMQINKILEPLNARLLPTASHPFMDPEKETQLWQHENKEIYALYHKIFGCNTHGWANLQSVHLNLPFSNDLEFARLHTAIRLVLPIIPALAASSPLRNGRLTGWKDSRLQAYLLHQEKVPSLSGQLIPEPVVSQAEYEKRIFLPIIHDFKILDPDKIMNHYFLNSRGAIARFDRGSIEIRVTDIQECPAADIAIVSFIMEVLKMLVAERHSGWSSQLALNEMDLKEIFLSTALNGENAVIGHPEFLRQFGIFNRSISTHEMLHHLLEEVKDHMSVENRMIISRILQNGSLATRITNELKDDFRKECIIDIYRELSLCLQENRLF